MHFVGFHCILVLYFGTGHFHPYCSSYYKFVTMPVKQPWMILVDSSCKPTAKQGTVQHCTHSVRQITNATLLHWHLQWFSKFLSSILSEISFDQYDEFYHNDYNVVATYLTPMETGALYNLTTTCLLIQIITNLLATRRNYQSLGDANLKLFLFNQRMLESVLKFYIFFYDDLFCSKLLLVRIMTWHWISEMLLSHL